MKFILLPLAFIVAFLMATFPGEVINGEEIPRSLYPEVVLVKPSGCTGALLSPNVVLTAGHCASKKSFTIEVNGVIHSGVLTRARGPDIALGKLSTDVLLPEYATLNPFLPVKGMSVDLVGFGCTKWRTSVGYGVLRRGTTAVTGLLKYDFTGQGKSAICQGDSGGPAFISGTHDIMGVHSKGNGKTSYEVRLDTDEVFDFVAKWAKENVLTK